MKDIKITRVTILHYIKLIYRSLLFISALIWYVYKKINEENVYIDNSLQGKKEWILVLIWIIYMIEMVLRFFPSKLESPGCQKQFKINYKSTGRTDVQLHDNNATVIVILVWIILNAVFGALYMIKIFDQGLLLLISLAYSVCDIICILFFCPFQTWFLENKCCSTCRIYNWDYAMMFTPFFSFRANIHGPCLRHQ